MLKTGKEHLEGLNDGRTVYIGNEKVDNVTTHPAFRNAAKTVAALYDVKHDPEFKDMMSFEENGERYSMWFLRAKSKDDLRKRTAAHKKIADLSCGLFGRSPDHVSSFVTGMSTNPSAFDSDKYKFGDNLLAYYEHMRKNDTFATYAVLPPQAARDPEFYTKQNIETPTLRVVREDDDGVVVSGMKMLATSAVFCDEIWIGNLLPLAPSQVKEAITCAVPCNAEGMSLWMRQPISLNADNEFDSPLTWKYDETDVLVICDEVKIPWEKVFVMDDAILARSIYIDTPAHCYGNHQANVRFWAKMQLILGLCSKITQATGANKIPAVAETLGRMSALEATIAGMVHGQIEAAEEWPEGYATYNRRMMYAALNWCTESHSQIVDQLRELCGGGVLQMPANSYVMHDEKMRLEFERHFQTPQLEAIDRMKLFRLAWDFVGSEFAGRQQQYEKFYAGASFIVRNHSHRETDWGFFDGIVDNFMSGYDVPKPK
jgi:4-hydroxyphenylacetate 3-monooxygenase